MSMVAKDERLAVQDRVDSISKLVLVKAEECSCWVLGRGATPSPVHLPESCSIRSLI